MMAISEVPGSTVTDRVTSPPRLIVLLLLLVAPGPDVGVALESRELFEVRCEDAKRAGRQDFFAQRIADADALSRAGGCKACKCRGRMIYCSL